MPNIGMALASSTLIGGVVVMLAILAYEKFKESQRQQERRQAYQGSSRPSGSRTTAPPQPSNDCSICRDGLSSPLEILPCGHIFHRQCISQWFVRRMICPVCRQRISDDLKADYCRRLGIANED